MSIQLGLLIISLVSRLFRGVGLAEMGNGVGIKTLLQNFLPGPFVVFRIHSIGKQEFCATFWRVNFNWRSGGHVNFFEGCCSSQDATTPMDERRRQNDVEEETEGYPGSFS